MSGSFCPPKPFIFEHIFFVQKWPNFQERSFLIWKWFLVHEFSFVWLLAFGIWSTLYMFDHISKTKRKKNVKSDLNLFQSNPHLSWQFGHLWTNWYFSCPIFFHILNFLISYIFIWDRAHRWLAVQKRRKIFATSYRKNAESSKQRIIKYLAATWQI